MGVCSFKVHEYVHQYKKCSETIDVVPFGDIHRSSPLCHLERWRKFLNEEKNKENVLYLGMGDYLDVLSTSERKGIMQARLHDSTLDTFEDLYERWVDVLYNEISFMKGKLIGLIEGNHHAIVQGGITTTQLLARKLNCAYLGTSAFIRLSLKNPKRSTYSTTIWAHHGKGAARTIGSSINSIDQMTSFAEAQIYLQGHDHKRGIGTKSRLMLTPGPQLVLNDKTIIMARTGSFLKGYEDGKRSYVAEKLLSPVDLGVVRIHLTPKHNKYRTWLEVGASL